MKRPVLLFSSAIGILSISILLNYHGNWLTIDKFFILGIVFTLLLGRAIPFILDWSPFVVLLLSYEFLRGIVPFISNNVHITPLIDADMALFRFLPVLYLQSLFFTPDRVQWYDYATALIYFSHFTSPILVAFILWLRNRKHYLLFVVNLLFVSFLGFLTYIAYPAMPPWLAAQEGHIPHVYKIIYTVFDHLGPSWNFTTIYNMMLGNPVAAMPSLHAAYPVVILLYVYLYLRRFTPIFFVYMLLVWYSTVYLGEHYVIDIIVGALFALFSFAVVYGLHYLSKTRWKGKVNFI